MTKEMFIDLRFLPENGLIGTIPRQKPLSIRGHTILFAHKAAGILKTHSGFFSSCSS